ncbi:hypothetical protein G7Y79_00021g050620 [Physcia stellaris]|nr:hypothetical protein G7Y79_00021g050620 [Physcia stellaris]
MAISTDVNAHGQMIMELRFSVAQAMIVCLVLIVFAIAATAVLVVAFFYYKLDSQKAVDLAGQNLSMKGRSAIKHSGIRSAGQNAKSLFTRQGRVDEQPESPFFNKLPAEIRSSVYQYLLRSNRDRILIRTTRLMSPAVIELVRKKVYSDDSESLDFMDATILRTCRRIYQEALPMLYGDNLFQFYTPAELNLFKTHSIMKNDAAKKKGSNMPIFNLHPSPQGRLSWIRRLALRFSDDIFHQQEQYHSYMGDWRDCLYEAFDANGLEYLCFPSLEQLMLNFRYWRLEKDDWVPVKPFALKFRGKFGLKLLMIVGMENEENLERYKRALLKDGGEFVPDAPPVRGQIHRANCKEPILFLKNCLQSIKQFQSINSDQIVQCIDHDTGEQLQILRQAPKPSYLRLEPNRGGYVTFTTCGSPKPYELAFDTSSLLPDHRYRLHFNQTVSITHWLSTSEESMDALSPGPEWDIPTPSPTKITWTLIGDNDATFKTLTSPSAPPIITATLSAPATFSLSSNPPFTFTLTFSTDPQVGITVLAERPRVARSDLDIEILDAETGARIGPEPIEENLDGPWQREEFLRIDGTYTETRSLDAKRLMEFGGQGMRVGQEYVLRHLGERWEWWSEDLVDEVMEYAGERGGMGLGRMEGITVESGGEMRFKVVE